MFFSKESQNELRKILPETGEAFNTSELQELSLILTMVSGCCLSMRVRERSVGRELPSSKPPVKPPLEEGTQQALPGLEIDEQGQDAPQKVVDCPGL